MCCSKDNLSSILNYVFPYHIIVVHVFQLSITYHHGVTVYSTQKLWLYLGMWYSNYPHLSFFSFPQLLHLIALFSNLIFLTPPYYTNIENSFNNDGKSFYPSISCMQWTSWYQKKVTNWDFPLCLFTSIQLYHYDQFFS